MLQYLEMFWASITLGMLWVSTGPKDIDKYPTMQKRVSKPQPTPNPNSSGQNASVAEAEKTTSVGSTSEVNMSL